MVQAVLLLSLLAAPKVAVPSLGYVGLPDSEGDVYADYFADRLAKESGADVVTRSQVAQLLGFERQKQLMGCSDGTSCTAELAGALGVDFIVTGSFAKLGTGFTVTLKLVDVRTATALASESERVANVDRLFEMLVTIAGRMGERLAPKRKAGAPVWIAYAAAGALGAASLLTFIGAKTDAEALRSGTFMTSAQLQETARRGGLLQVVSGALLAGSSAALIAAIVWTVVAGRPPAAQSGWWVGPSGFGWSGALP